EPEGPERLLVTLPEAPTGTPDVPVRQVVDETLERPQHVGGDGVLVALRRLDDELLGVGSQPAVEGAQVRSRKLDEVGIAGAKGREVGVFDEEGGGIPERQQVPFDLMTGPEPEPQILRWRL